MNVNYFDGVSVVVEGLHQTRSYDWSRVARGGIDVHGPYCHCNNINIQLAIIMKYVQDEF